MVSIGAKQDDKFYTVGSGGHPTFPEYSGLTGTVPFIWESQPGTPKDTIPPPSAISLRRHSSLRLHPSNSLNDEIAPTIFPVLADPPPLCLHSSLRQQPSSNSQNYKITSKISTLPADSPPLTLTPPTSKNPNSSLRRNSSLRQPRLNSPNDEITPKASTTLPADSLRRHNSLRLPQSNSLNDKIAPHISTVSIGSLRRQSSLLLLPSNSSNDDITPKISTVPTNSPPLAPLTPENPNPSTISLRRNSSLRQPPPPSSLNGKITPKISIRHPLPPPPSLQLNRTLTPPPSRNPMSPTSSKSPRSSFLGPFLAKLLRLKMKFNSISPRSPTSLSTSPSANSFRSLSSSSSTRFMVSSGKKKNWEIWGKGSRFSSTPESSFDSKTESGDEESPTSTLCFSANGLSRGTRSLKLL